MNETIEELHESVCATMARVATLEPMNDFMCGYLAAMWPWN